MTSLGMQGWEGHDKLRAQALLALRAYRATVIVNDLSANRQPIPLPSYSLNPFSRLKAEISDPDRELVHGSRS